MSAEQSTSWNELSLNHESPVPLWVQLGREIRRRIAEHKLSWRTPLPSEAWFVCRYGLTSATVGKTIRALLDIGQIAGKRGDRLYVAQELPLEYVTVLPGSKITAPASHDPTIKSDVPWWAVVALRVETPGMEPIDFDGTRTVLLVA
jgi:DNA-binding transcriptional MocR family regulator